MAASAEFEADLEAKLRRPPRSEADTLAQEVRALELLANETVPTPEKTQEYWDVAADLIVLAADIEELRASDIGVPEDDYEVLSLKRRVRGIAARLSELAME